ncbi:MAG: SRPBCC family protein [Solirubrobacteraceae bacterium]
MYPVRSRRGSSAIGAPAADVWQLLALTRHWPRWGGSITAVEPGDEAISLGSRGRVRTVAGVWLPFRIDAFEDGQMWGWSVAGIPATRHRVEPRPGGCRASFDVPLAAWPYLLVCRDALRRIARIAESEFRP